MAPKFIIKARYQIAAPPFMNIEHPQLSSLSSTIAQSQQNCCHFVITLHINHKRVSFPYFHTKSEELWYKKLLGCLYFSN